MLAPRRVELRTSPLDGCTDDAQCEALADYAARAPSGSHPVDEVTPPDPRAWACVADPDRAPTATGKRCELRCSADADCTTGAVCQGGLCSEGVTPPQACVNGPARYELHAGQAFSVLGSRSGFAHAIVADAAGRCVRDPAANPLRTGRIPLVAPPCTGDPAGPNPCALVATTTDVLPAYVDAAGGNCALADQQPHLVERAAPAIRYRGPGLALTLVDPYYPGDARCILDRGGGLDRIPLVFPGYQLAFRQNAGFSPLVLGVKPALPIKVARGPNQTIWVIDQGDYLSEVPGDPSTTGKVFRVAPQALGVIDVLR